MNRSKNKKIVAPDLSKESESTNILKQAGLVPDGFKVFSAPFVKAEKYVEILSNYDVNRQYVVITLASIRGLSGATIAISPEVFNEFTSRFYQ